MNTLALEDGSDILLEDGTELLLEDGSAVGTGSLVTPEDVVAGFGEIPHAATIDCLGALALLSPAKGVNALGLTTTTILGPIDIRAQSLNTTTILGGIVPSIESLCALVLLMPPVRDDDAVSFSVRRPERIPVASPTVARRRPLSVPKTLPEPPKDYDVLWHQRNQAAIVDHLNNALTANIANEHVILRSPDGSAWKFTVADDGTLTAKPIKG